MRGGHLRAPIPRRGDGETYRAGFRYGFEPFPEDSEGSDGVQDIAVQAGSPHEDAAVGVLDEVSPVDQDVGTVRNAE